MATAAKFGAVPTLADLIEDPLKVSALPREAIPHLRGELAQLDTLLLCRLLEDKNENGADGDQLLDVAEAAARLSVSPDYLYRHNNLPFVRRVGRKLLFSAQGIDKYISKQRP